MTTDVQSADGESEACPLSKSLQGIVLDDPVLNSEHAVKIRWGSLALANMVAILRDHGFEVKAPEGGLSDAQQQIESAGPESAGLDPDSTDDDACSPLPSETVQLTESLARFHHVTSIMDQNRGEDGRVDAALLETLLLETDADAFDKEGVEHLKQYLMKARESGIPLKFEGDRSGLHQVWFKGHRDLATAIDRYGFGNGNNKTGAGRAATASSSPPSIPPTPARMDDWGSWRHRSSSQQQQQQHHHHHHQHQQYHRQGATSVFGYSTTTSGNGQGHHHHHHQDRHRNGYTGSFAAATASDERAFETDFLLEVLQTCGAEGQLGADAIIAEQHILDLEPSLYSIKPGVKRFNHYLMNMRAGGAPIWFNRDDNGQPKQIFIKGSSSPFYPLPPPSGDWSLSAQSSSGNNAAAAAAAAVVEERFASLIEAYHYHLQPDAGHADGHLVQARLESMDPNVYLREQCASFKSLLKLARTNGLNVNWEQSELDVATIRMGVAQ